MVEYYCPFCKSKIESLVVNCSFVMFGHRRAMLKDILAGSDDPVDWEVYGDNEAGDDLDFGEYETPCCYKVLKDDLQESLKMLINKEATR